MSVSEKELFDSRPDREVLGKMALEALKGGVDTSSDYRVGAALNVGVADGEATQHTTYRGSNINLSGFQTKRHAEQLALNQFIMDHEMREVDFTTQLTDVVVATSENDGALICGHCMQVILGACRRYNWNQELVDYTSVQIGERSGDEIEDELIFTTHTLKELMPESYVDMR